MGLVHYNGEPVSFETDWERARRMADATAHDEGDEDLEEIEDEDEDLDEEEDEDIEDDYDELEDERA